MHASKRIAREWLASPIRPGAFSAEYVAALAEMIRAEYQQLEDVAQAVIDVYPGAACVSTTAAARIKAALGAVRGESECDTQQKRMLEIADECARKMQALLTIMQGEQNERTDNQVE